MALIRGLRGLFPCPRCLVPSDELTQFMQHYAFRSTVSMKSIVEKANSFVLAGDKEELLKSYGLRSANVSRLIYFLD
jgi:phage-related baseplate assembly protein